jgi:hypothetical protein
LGKEAIGIFATVLKINSALQAAKINYDTNCGSDRKSFENPFFEVIAYVDFESGYYRVKADLDLLIWIVYHIYNIAESTELQKTIASWFSQKENY